MRRTGASIQLEIGGRCESADLVVLCLPFTALRRADLGGAGLSATKLRALRELGMGTNSKVLIQFRRHFRHYDRWDGEYYDRRIDTWDSTLGERGRAAVLTVYAGGRVGTDFPAGPAHRPAPTGVVERETGAIGRVVPGLASGFNGRAWLDVWARDPYVHGSYAAYMPGQFTRFWGRAGTAEGNIHFGGEQTQTVGQGYLEGAVASGERCAREVAAKLI
jgi:monoamine oxidase